MCCVQYTSLKLILRFEHLSVAGQLRFLHLTKSKTQLWKIRKLHYCFSEILVRTKLVLFEDTFRIIRRLFSEKALIPLNDPTPHMCILLGIHINVKTSQSITTNSTLLYGKSIQCKQLMQRWNTDFTLIPESAPISHAMHASLVVESGPTSGTGSRSLARAHLLEVDHSRNL